MVWTTPKKSFKIRPNSYRNAAAYIRSIRRARRNFIKKLNPGRKIFSYKRNVLRTAIQQTQPLDLTGSMVFKLSDLSNVSEFTTLYDSYKIGKIVVRFIPQQNVQPMVSPLVTAVPKLFTVIDHDDAVTPVNINELREYETLKVARGLKEHKRIFRPAVAMALYGKEKFVLIT